MPLDPSDPLLAVIAPPRVKRFRELAGLGPDDDITADFSGWSKLVLLTHDRAFLFCRDHRQSAYMRREVEALEVVAQAGLEVVPKVLDVWDDPSVSAHPVVVTSRLPGQLLAHRVDGLSTDELAGVLQQLGTLAARWHGVDPGRLAHRPARTHPPQVLADELLGTSEPTLTVDELVARVAPLLDLDRDERTRLTEVLGEVRRLPVAVVHGDLHEGQVLVDDDLNVTGIFDWQTARLAHPFTEFDLGEWGTGTWRCHRRSFPELRRRQWDAYASARGVAPDLGDCFEALWSVAHALRWPESVFAGDEVTGPRDEAMEAVHRALA